VQAADCYHVPAATGLNSFFDIHAAHEGVLLEPRCESAGATRHLPGRAQMNANTPQSQE